MRASAGGLTRLRPRSTARPSSLREKRLRSVEDEPNVTEHSGTGADQKWSVNEAGRRCVPELRQARGLCVVLSALVARTPEARLMEAFDVRSVL